MSKFDAIMKAKRGEPEPAEAPSASKPEPPSPALPEAPVPRKRGRPPGKRSSEDHEQVTAYIRRETHLKVKMALLQDGEVQDFSELIEGLLGKWIGSRT
jgi:hypothetical protein